MIHICYAVIDEDASYYLQLGASMLSIVEQASIPVTFHLLTDGCLPQNSIAHLKCIESAFRAHILFYPVDIDALRSMVVPLVDRQCIEKHSVATLFRLFIDNVLPQNIDRVLYLDVDTIAYIDIHAVLKDMPESVTCAGVPDLNIVRKNTQWQRWVQGLTGIDDMKNYINAGVLWLNLSRLRHQYHFLEDVLRFFREHPKSFFGDQDAINAIFGARKDLAILPEAYNQYVVDLKKLSQTSQVLRNGIYHWAAIRTRQKHDSPGENVYDDLYWIYEQKFQRMK